MHREIEFCYLIGGSISVLSRGEKLLLNPGDFWIINPWQVHDAELLSREVAAFVPEIQIALPFFTSYFPQMSQFDFDFRAYNAENLRTAAYEEILGLFASAAKCYFVQEDCYELRCAGLINLLFDRIIHSVDYRVLSEKDQRAGYSRANKLRDITEYIENNYRRKLLLSEIAEHEGMTMNYLSHFFQKSFGISYQEYLKRLRCEKAGDLISKTTLPFTEISDLCGFSDYKYFRSAFFEAYGYSPKAYRIRQNDRADNLNRNDAPKTKQSFLSREESLVILNQYLTSDGHGNPVNGRRS